MKIIETDGIVIKTIDFKENDSILTFLTKKKGPKILTETDYGRMD